MQVTVKQLFSLRSVLLVPCLLLAGQGVCGELQPILPPVITQYPTQHQQPLPPPIDAPSLTPMPNKSIEVNISESVYDKFQGEIENATQQQINELKTAFNEKLDSALSNSDLKAARHYRRLLKILNAKQ